MISLIENSIILLFPIVMYNISGRVSIYISTLFDSRKGFMLPS